MIGIQSKDSRAYFMLPQAPQDAGYYVYGKIDGRRSHGAFQYAPPSMMTAILRSNGNGRRSTIENLASAILA